MRKLKRWICLFIAILLLLPVSAHAVESDSVKTSNFFARSSTYLYKTSTIRFQVWFNVTAKRTMDELGASTITVQRSSDGETWRTMRTYTKEDFPDMICENTVAHSSHVNYTGSGGFYYRALVEFYAKDSAGTGYVTEYTTPILLG